MANELEISNPSGANLYAIIRRQSDGYVWNGSAFAAWADGSIASYDIALTDRGGDLYQADWPTATGAGNYRIYYYERAGATPAITDVILASASKTWDGIGLSDASEVTLSSTALTTLAALKRHLRETTTDNDTILTECINAASAFIENVCGRYFLARDYRERYTGDHQRRLTLRQYPIIAITRIARGWNNAMSVTHTGSAIRASVSVAPDRVRLNSVSPLGVATTTDLAFATYPSVSTLVTAINAVSGWSATTVSNQPSADLNPTGGEDALGRLVTFTYPDIDDNAYSVDYDRGLVEFNRDSSWWLAPHSGEPQQVYRDTRRLFRGGMSNVIVEYRAGYDTIPADVAMVCRELATDKYYAGLDNPSIKSQTMGVYSVAFTDEDYQEVRSRLSQFMSDRAFVGGA